MRFQNRYTLIVMLAVWTAVAGGLTLETQAQETLAVEATLPAPVVTPVEKQPLQTFYPALTKTEERLEQALKIETEGNFPDVPLSETMTYFSDLHNVPIVIQRTDLEHLDISVDTPIDMQLTGISLKNALIQILDPLNLTYVVDRELILITTKDTAREMLKARVYPVGDLCRTVPEDYQTLADAIRNANLGDWRPELPAPTPEGADAGMPGAARQRFANDAGGTITIVPQTQSLVISQTYHSHNAIEQLLTQLRQAKAAQ